MKRLAVLALVLLALPMSAQAAVSAPQGVRAAMLRDTHGTPQQCFTVRLAHRGSGWGIIYAKGTARGACDEVQSGDFSIVRLHRGRWVQVTGGDELAHQRCPIESDPHQPTLPSSILYQLTGKRCGQKPLVLVPTYLDANPGQGMRLHPGTIVYTGAGTGALERLRWSHWGSRVTQGSGVDAIKTCTPDCASGPTSYYPVRVEGNGLSELEGVMTYTRVRVTYTDAVPSFNGRYASRTYTLKASYYGGEGGGFSL